MLTLLITLLQIFLRNRITWKITLPSSHHNNRLSTVSVPSCYSYSGYTVHYSISRAELCARSHPFLPTWEYTWSILCFPLHHQFFSSSTEHFHQNANIVFLPSKKYLLETTCLCNFCLIFLLPFIAKHFKIVTTFTACKIFFLYCLLNHGQSSFHFNYSINTPLLSANNDIHVTKYNS